jgi:hypothetical protein
MVKELAGGALLQRSCALGFYRLTCPDKVFTYYN